METVTFIKRPEAGSVVKVYGERSVQFGKVVSTTFRMTRHRIKNTWFNLLTECVEVEPTTEQPTNRTDYFLPENRVIILNN